MSQTPPPEQSLDSQGLPLRRATRNTLSRDAFIGATCGVLVLVFVVYGIWSMAKDARRKQDNTLVGVIVEKQFTPLQEELITFGRNGLKSKHSEGEYVLKVTVEGFEQTFEVPVEQSTYEHKKVGDPLTFIRKPTK